MGKKTMQLIKVHAEYAKRHAKIRIKERFGIKLRPNEKAEIRSKIKKKNALYLERQGKYRYLWQVFVRGKHMRIVYDNELDCIVTVLPI